MLTLIRDLAFDLVGLTCLAPELIAETSANLRLTAFGTLSQDAPSTDTDGELVAGDQEAVFDHCCVTYKLGAAGMAEAGPLRRSDRTARRAGRFGVRERLATR